MSDVKLDEAALEAAVNALVNVAGRRAGVPPVTNALTMFEGKARTYFLADTAEIIRAYLTTARTDPTLTTEVERLTLNDLARVCHEANIKWWRDPATGEPIERNKGELLCLIHSEISEAMEGERKGLMDDKLPHRKMAEVELVDALIRIFDYAGAFGYDLEGAFHEKMSFNAQRADHQAEARLRAGGKKW